MNGPDALPQINPLPRNPTRNASPWNPPGRGFLGERRRVCRPRLTT